MVGYFVRDVNALLVDLIGRHNLILWMGEKGRQPGSEVVRGHWVFETARLMAKSTLLIRMYKINIMGSNSKRECREKDLMLDVMGYIL